LVTFTRLRLFGFKTFVEPTDFLIEPGLTGIVGPNGCGKSNLVEAMRWVMGESSYKSMRASGMDDVIFSGSNRRPARNSAEVILTLTGVASRAATSLPEAEVLEVSRRIEREAGSTYRVNGREVRARDVQLLFADASTGSRSPAMVGQGRIGELIAAKPLARRAILEEASGISGLHSRRNEAEIRLKAAGLNLDRVEDVLSEFEVRLESLKRQARQAARYRALSAEIRRGEATLALLRWLEARGRVEDGEAEAREAVRLADEKAVEQARLAADQATGAAGLPALRETEAAAGAALQRLRLAAGEVDAEERRIRARLEELDRRLLQIDSDLAREAGLGDDMAAALAGLDDEEATLVGEDDDAGAARAEAEDRLAEAEADLTAAETDLAGVQSVAAEAAARRAALVRTRDEIADRLARLAADRDGLGRERAALAADLAAGADPADLAAEVEELAAVAAEAEAAVAEAEEAEVLARGAEETARAAVVERERDLSRLEAEAKALARVLDVAAGVLWPPILDRVVVASGYEAALGAALGDDLDVSDAEGAPVSWRMPGAADADPPLPDGVEPLAARVVAPPVLARRLAQIGVVDAALGDGLRDRLAPGQRLVSRAGDLWRWDGLTASAEAPTAAARRLESRNRLAELEGETAAARTAVATRRSALDGARRGRELAEETTRAAREATRRAARAESEARDRLARLEREAARLAARRAALEATAARLEEEEGGALAARDETVAALAAAPDPAVFTADLTRARATVAERRAVVAELGAVARGLAREAEGRRRRREAIAAERAAWSGRAAAAERQRAVLAERRAEAIAERDELIERPADLEIERGRLRDAISVAEAERARAADALVAGERAQADADVAARLALDALATAREARGRAEERLAAARARLAEIAAGIAETFEVAPTGLVALTDLDPAEPPPEAETVDRRLERLRIDRDRLGAVNLRAEEEVREIEERRDALLAERDDLVEAIRRLRQSIQTLNREARDRLMAAFDTVNGHFRDLFAHLFGGGEAELQLIDAEDPLEAGLEIFARPPGKKPSTMTLLSGGEQALTALALIFAVFLTNPAPICVLDEVDAPLDDANVERCCDLLDAMVGRTDTRFVVITHNPITMARMDRLFGVTMAERGASQLVSVDLERAERILAPV
jgi:chromosome segregation protein